MRRDIIITAIVFGVCIQFSADLSCQDNTAPKPNIIFFIADDIDKYQIGCFGGPVYTPSLDELAAEGAVFNQAFVSSTVCTPSRYSLATGRFPGRSMFPDYLDEYPTGTQGHPEFNVGLERDYRNIGKVLGDNGYTTGWIGKFHLHTDDLYNGLTAEEISYLNKASADDPRATELFCKRERAFRDYIVGLGFSWAKNIYEGNLEDPFNEHNLEWTIEAALEFIETNKDTPFYLHFNTTLLHGTDRSWENSMEYPLYSGEGILEKEADAEMPPRETVNERILEHGFNLKDNPSGITWLDDGVGAIMNKLDELGLSDNTLIVFIPDHGSVNKASLFNQDGCNIPMIIRYPEEIPPGTVCNTMVQTIDLIPTFYELAGVILPEGYWLDGLSIRPLFSKPTLKIHESLYFELGCARAVMTENFKYIAVRYTVDRTNRILAIPEKDLKNKVMGELYYLNGHAGISSRGIRYNPDYLNPDQLYNLNEDPGELNNLAGDPVYSETLEEMQSLLKDYLVTFENRPFGEFIPGPNATAPDPTVRTYLKNIRNALRQGAYIDGGKIICEGNCVTEPFTGIGSYSVENQFYGHIIQHPGNLRVLLDEPGYDIRFYDLAGRLLYCQETLQDKEIYIDKEWFPAGFYLLSLTNEGTKITSKIFLY